MSRFHSTLALLCLLLFGGCGESTTVTVIAPRPAVPQATATTATTPTVAQVAQPNPVVHFTLTTTSPEGTWPFIAQLASITTNPNGVTGSDRIPPQDTYLIIKVNVTSSIMGRVPPPKLHVGCHGPNSGRWQLAPPLSIGYDRGSARCATCWRRSGFAPVRRRSAPVKR
jgi:hypothetical protein